MSLPSSCSTGIGGDVKGSLSGTFVQTAVLHGAAAMYGKSVEACGDGRVRVRPVAGWGSDQLGPGDYDLLKREDDPELVADLERVDEAMEVVRERQSSKGS